MRVSRPRWLVGSLAISLSLLTAGPAVQAQDETEQPVCALLTAQEVGQAIGAEVAEGVGWSYEGYATCDWIALDPASFAYADAEWQGITLDQISSGMPGGTELTVGGRPAYLAPDVGALFIQLESGLLTLSMEGGSPDIDIQTALTALGEAAIPRAGSLPVPPAVEPTDLEEPGPPEGDAVADAFCALFTPEEVGAVLGTEVEAAPSFESCSWTSTAQDGSFASFSAGWTFGTLDDQRQTWPDGQDLTVGGLPAYSAPELGSLFVETSDGTLMLTAFGFGADGSELDAEAALASLGELAAARTATLLPPAPVPTFAPAQLMHDDPELEALFPTTIGGETVVVQSTGGEALRSGTDSDFAASIEALLTEQGKTFDDVSVAFGGAGLESIVAFRVKGGDAAALATLILDGISGSAGLEPEPAQVAGKDVLIAREGDRVWHVYPQGEVLWVLSSDEPALTEILSALP
jgi:hypothetical protein